MGFLQHKTDMNPQSLVRFLTMNAQVSRGFVSGALILGLSSTLWSLDAMRSPSISYAYTMSVDVTLDRLPFETLDALIKRAELVARAAAQRSFDRDILASDVSIIITGRQGEIAAPILTLAVSRSQWQTTPDARRWATYYRTSTLGFGKQPLGLDR